MTLPKLCLGHCLKDIWNNLLIRTHLQFWKELRSSKHQKIFEIHIPKKWFRREWLQMFPGPIWGWIKGLHFQINKIKYFQHLYNNENFSKPQTLYEKHVKNFSSGILHNLSCIHATYLEGPTISYNLKSDH